MARHKPPGVVYHNSDKDRFASVPAEEQEEKEWSMADKEHLEVDLIEQELSALGLWPPSALLSPQKVSINSHSCSYACCSQCYDTQIYCFIAGKSASMDSRRKSDMKVTNLVRNPPPSVPGKHEIAPWLVSSSNRGGGGGGGSSSGASVGGNAVRCADGSDGSLLFGGEFGGGSGEEKGSGSLVHMPFVQHLTVSATTRRRVASQNNLLSPRRSIAHNGAGTSCSHTIQNFITL